MPSEGIEPPSAPYRVAALGLSYPGSTVAVAGPWKIKRDNRFAIYACRVASLDALTRGVRLAVDRRPGEAGLRDAEPRATIGRGDYVLAAA